MAKTYRSHKDIIAKTVLKEIDLMLLEAEKNLKYRSRHSQNLDSDLKYLDKLNPFFNPKNTIKDLKTIKFAFEWELYAADPNWTRSNMIRKEYQKVGLDFDNVYSYCNDKELKTKARSIILVVDRKLYKKKDKGLRLFAKHFFSFDMIKS